MDEEWFWVASSNPATDSPNYVLAKAVDAKSYLSITGETLRKEAKQECFSIIDVKLLQEVDTPDLVECADLSDPSIVYSLEKRLKNKSIYTFVGDIIICMNPFTRLPVYTSELIKFYEGKAQAHHERGADIPPPHIFYTTDDALFQLWSTNQSQSIIISGESGAGKTETAKQVLHFIGDVCGKPAGPGEMSFENLILQSSPVLEAFGNAKTKRNDNSSRFGKYCTVYFDQDKKIAGCGNISYLLEKSRVCFQDKNERNFHAFYQFLKGNTAGLRRIRAEMNMGDGAPMDCNEFNFLNTSGCIDLPNKNDVEDYKETEDAMNDLKLDQKGIWRITAAILYLGNAKFYKNTKDNAGSPESTEADDFVHFDGKQDPNISLAAQMLGLDDVRMNTGVCCKIIQKQSIALKKSVSQTNLLTFCKFVYDRLFVWMIDNVNESMRAQSGGRVTPDAVGILDIFGFEKFDKNSLEQLCINYTNERLQFQFNEHVFAQEKKIYAAEGLDFSKLEGAFTIITALVEHNKGACTVLGGLPESTAVDKKCVLSLLNEQSKGVGDDMVKLQKVFLDSVFKAHTSGVAPFIGKQISGVRTDPNAFIVDHYAGKITYSVLGFVEKDKDSLAADMMVMVKASDDPFLRGLFAKEDSDDSGPADSKGAPITPKKAAPSPKAAGAAPAKEGISVKFNKALRSLMRDLDATGSHYMRCIKSNDLKQPLTVYWPEVLRQLKYAGVQQVITIRKHGFLYKPPFDRFVTTYHGILAFQNIKKETVFPSLKAECEALIKHMEFKDTEVMMGNSRLFYRTDQHRIMQKHLKIAQIAVKKVVVDLYNIALWRRNFKKFVCLSRHLKNALAEINFNCNRAKTLADKIDRIEFLLAQSNKVPLTALQFPIAINPQLNKMSLIDALIFPAREILKEWIAKGRDSLAPLKEAHRIQTALEECLADPDAEARYEQIKALVKDGRKMGMDEKKNPSVANCKVKVQPVIKKIKCMNEFEISLREGDEKMLKNCLETAKALGIAENKAVAEKVKAANDSLVKIENEKKIIAELDGLLQTGGWINPKDVPRYTELEQCLNHMKAWPGGINGRKGKQQMFLAEMCIGIRKTLVVALPSIDENDWEPVGKYFETMDDSIRNKKAEIETLIEEAKKAAALPAGQEVDPEDAEEAAALKVGKSKEDFLKEDVEFVENISKMKEFKIAYVKYDEMSIKSKCRKQLRAAAEAFDLIMLDEKIKWAADLNMQESSESSLRTAMSVAHQLRVVCGQCQTAIEVNRKAAEGVGIVAQHTAELRKVMDLVDSKYPAMKAVRDYKDVVAELKLQEVEAIKAAELKKDIDQGAWVSGSSVLGNFDTYPEYSSTAIRALSAAAINARELPMRTVSGRRVVDFASTLCEVRKMLSDYIRDVKENPVRSFADMWLSLAAKLESLDKEFKVAGELVGGAKVAAELAEFERQLGYQRTAFRISTAIAAAEENRQEAELELQLKAAKAASMLAKFNPLMGRAEAMLQRIQDMKRLLVESMEKVNLRGLEEVLAMAKDLRYGGEQVVKCAHFREILLSLAEAERDYSEEGLAKALADGKAAGMNQQAIPVMKATSVLQRVIKCREIATSAVASTKQSIAEQGATENDIGGLSQALEIAAGIGGQTHVAAVNEAAALFEELRGEAIISSNLSDACVGGAWVNAGVRSGDYEKYQSGDSIDSAPLKKALEAARAAQLKSLKARFSFLYAEILVQIRDSLKVILSTPVSQRTLDAWSSIAKLMDSRVVLAVESKSLVPELVAIRKELIFNSQAASVLRELPSTTSNRRKLEECLAEAKVIGLSSTAFPALTAFTNACASLVRLEAALRERQEDELTSALADIKSHELIPSSAPLVQQATTLLAKLVSSREMVTQTLISLRNSAKDEIGATAQQQVALEKALLFAERHGQFQASVVQEARVVHDELKSECAAIEQLTTALNSGAWVNSGVVAGDWENYQPASTVSVQAITDALAAVKSGSLHTSEGRKCVRFAEAIVNLRQLVITALNTSYHDMERWVPASQALATAEALQYRRFADRELNAIRRELAHSDEMKKTIAELKEGSLSVNAWALRTSLAKAERLGMEEKHFTMLVSARATLALSTRLSEAIFACDEAQLNSALKECNQHGLNAEAVDIVRARALLQIVAGLSFGIANSDEKALKVELAKFAAMGLPENPRTIEARRVQAAIADVQRGAADVLASVASSIQAAGISSADCVRLKELVTQVDVHLAGLPGVDIIVKLRRQLAAVEFERKVLKSIQDALSIGGWTNASANMKAGDLSTYQPASTIEVQNLRNLLNQQDFCTEAGRWLARWGKVVVRLRQAMITALQQPSTENWRAVQMVVNEALPKYGNSPGLDNPSFTADYVIMDSFAEFVAARSEYRYQFGMGEQKKQALFCLQSTVVELKNHKSIAIRCERLRAAVQVCLSLDMAAETDVASSQRLLAELEGYANSFEDVLRTWNLTQLKVILEIPVRDCQEFAKCVEATGLLSDLEVALKSKDYTRVVACLAAVRECGAQTAGLYREGQQFIERTQQLAISIQLIAQSANAAKRDVGVTPAQYAQMVQVVQAAAEAGLTGVPGMEALQAEVRAYEGEMKVMAQLKEAMLTGAFIVNSSVRLGDYGRYPKTIAGSWKAAEFQLEAAVKTGISTGEGRWMHYSCSKLIGLRRLMVPLMDFDAKTATICDEVLAYLSVNSGDVFYPRLAALQEWQCCLAEARYQKTVMTITNEINFVCDHATDLTSTVDHLGAILRRGEEANMVQTPTYNMAKAVLTRAQDTLKTLKEAMLKHELLESAINFAKKHDFDGTPEAEQAQHLFEVLQELKVCIPKSDEKAIRVQLAKFVELYLPENGYTMEAQRVLAQIVEVERQCGVAMAAVSALSSPDAAGVSAELEVRLKELIKLADTQHAGLPGQANVEAVRKQLFVLESEQRVISSLKKALSQGGWTNSGNDVKIGDLSTYQASSTVDVVTLSMMLSQQGTFFTEAGRWLARWCRVISRLRIAVVAALKQSCFDNWRAVQTVVAEALPKFGTQAGLQNVEVTADFVFLASFGEFVAARAECTFQCGLFEQKRQASLRLATAVSELKNIKTVSARCERLGVAVQSCIALEMTDEKDVVSASASLADHLRWKALFEAALHSFQLNDLKAAVDLPLSTSDESILCQQAYTLLSELERSLQAKNFLEVFKKMAEIRGSVLLRNSVIEASTTCVQALTFIARVQPIVSLIESLSQVVNAAKREGGITPEIFDQLVEVKRSAVEFSGVPGLDALKFEVQTYEKEMKILSVLKESIALGMFVYPQQISCGDYQQYPRLRDGSWLAAESQLQAVVKTGIITSEGQWMQYSCSKLIGLRKLLLQMMTVETKTVDSCNAVLAYLADGSGDAFYARLSATAEWQCCLREAAYQKTVLTISDQIELVVHNSTGLSSSSVSLSAVLKLAAEHNMTSLDVYKEGSALLGRINETLSTLKDALDNHGLLDSAIRQATLYGFEGTPEAVKAHSLHEIVLALHVGIKTSDEKALQAQLDKFELLALPENYLTIEARRVQAQIADMQRLMADLMSSIAMSKPREAAGISTRDCLRLKELVAQVDHTLAGLHGVDIINQARSTLATIEAERKTFATLKDALTRGGWVNLQATTGVPSTYQVATSVDVTSLETILQRQKEFVTATGRWIAKWAQSVIRLRQAVVAALTRGTLAYWRVVDGVLQEIMPSVGPDATPEDVSFACDYVFGISFSEFVSARKECDFQFNVGENRRKALLSLRNTLTDLPKSSEMAVRCQKLRTSVLACDELELSDHKDVVEAKASLSGLEKILVSLQSALRTQELPELQILYRTLAGVDIQCDEFTRCCKLQTVLSALSAAVSRQDYAGVLQGAAVAREASATASPVYRAAQLFLEDAMKTVMFIGVISKEAAAAKKDVGISPKLHAQMVQAVLEGASYTGISGLEELQADVKAYDGEMKLLGALKAAMAEWAFVFDPKIKSGDYKKYPKVFDGSWLSAETQLQTLIRNGLISAEGQWVRYSCSKLIGLRKLMIVMLTVETKSQMSCDAVLSYCAAASGDALYARLSILPEWQCSLAEAVYQKTALVILARIQEIFANATDLSVTVEAIIPVLKQAEAHNMTLTDEYLDAMAVLARIQETRAAIKNACETLSFPPAMTIVSQYGFDYSSEARAAQKLQEAVLDIKLAISKSDEKALRASLNLFTSLGVPENYLSAEARRVLAGVSILQCGIEQVMNSAEMGMRFAGISVADHNRLKDLVLQADSFYAGFPGNVALDKVRAFLPTLDAESKIVASLKDALRVGGWTNSNAVPGLKTTYQLPNTINVNAIESLLGQHKESNFLTEVGRYTVKWAKVVLRLRKSVYKALTESSTENWAAVDSVVQSCAVRVNTDALSDNSSFMSDFVFLQTFNEIIAAQREYTAEFERCAKREGVLANLSSTLACLPQIPSLAVRCERMKASIAAANNIGLQEEKIVLNAAIVSEGLCKLCSALQDALKSLNIHELESVVKICDASALECEELTRAKALFDLQVEIPLANQSGAIARLDAVLDKANQYGVEKLCGETRLVRSKVLSLRGQAEEILASMHASFTLGISESEIKKIQVLAKHVSALNGCPGLPIFDEMREEIKLLDAEAQTINWLSVALQNGGWVNTGKTVRIGEWTTYQNADTIEWGELEAARRFEARTEEGKRVAGWAAVVSRLRQLVKFAVDRADPNHMFKALEHLLKYRPRSMGSSSGAVDQAFYDDFAEFVAVRKVCATQDAVLASLRECRDGETSLNPSLLFRENRLSLVLASCQSLHMGESFDEVRSANRLLSQIVECRRALNSACQSMKVADLRGAVQLQGELKSHELQRAQEHLRVAEVLEPALAQCVEAKIREGVQLAQSLGIGNNTLVTAAEQMLGKIENVTTTARSAMLQFGKSLVTDGASKALREQFEYVVIRASGMILSDPENVDNLRAQAARMVKEERDLKRLRVEMVDGGWLNQGATRGDFKTYQSAASVETFMPLCLFEILPEMVTEEGKQLLEWARTVTKLRVLVKAALETRTSAPLWNAVGAFLQPHQFVSSGGNASLPCSPEFIEAMQEVEYQKKVQFALANLTEAINAPMDSTSRERLLDKWIFECLHLRMREEYPEVAQAISLLETLRQAKERVAQALSTLHPQLLEVAISEAAKAKLDSTDRKRCETLSATLARLQKCVDDVNMDGIGQVLVKAAGLGMPETTVTARARAMHAKLVEITNAAEVALPAPAKGFSNEQIAKLQWIVVEADSALLKGMVNYPKVVDVRSMLARLEAERKALNSLREALNSGGWTAPGLGSTHQYLKCQQLNVRQIAAAIEETGKIEVNSEEGRWLVKWAGFVVVLRQGVMEVARDPFGSLAQWQRLLASLDAKAVPVTTAMVHARFEMSEHAFFAYYPEFVALRQEVAFQEKLHASMQTLGRFLNTYASPENAEFTRGLELIELERKMDILMQEIVNYNLDAEGTVSILRLGRAKRESIANLRHLLNKGIQDLDPRGLSDALELARANNLETVEVAKAREALAIAQALRQAISDMNAADIQKHILSASAIGVFVNNVINEANRVASKVTCILTEAKDALVVDALPLDSWSGPTATHLRKLLKVLEHLDDPEVKVSGMLETEKILAIQARAKHLQQEVDTLSKESQRAVEALDPQALRSVWDRAMELKLTASALAEHQVYNLLQMHDLNPEEFLRLQRKRDKKKIVALLETREKFVHELAEFEKMAADPQLLFGDSRHFLDHENFRKSQYPKLHDMHAELRSKFREFQQRYKRRVIWRKKDASDEMENDIRIRFGSNDAVPQIGMRNLASSGFFKPPASSQNAKEKEKEKDHPLDSDEEVIDAPRKPQASPNKASVNKASANDSSPKNTDGSSKRKSLVLSHAKLNESKSLPVSPVPSLPVDIWQSLADKLPTTKSKAHSIKRKALFRSFDMNGNGHLSLAEVDRGIQAVLNCKELFDVKPVILRAFNAAKNLNGTQTGPMADFIQYIEFRAVLSFLRQYFEYWVMFDRIDTSRDHRIDFNEFERALAEIKKWGIVVRDPRAAFDEIDVNHQGIILFGEFANWAIENSLDLENDDNDEESKGLLHSQESFSVNPTRGTSQARNPKQKAPASTDESASLRSPASRDSTMSLSRASLDSKRRNGSTKEKKATSPQAQVLSRKTPGFNMYQESLRSISSTESSPRKKDPLSAARNIASKSKKAKAPKRNEVEEEDQLSF